MKKRAAGLIPAGHDGHTMRSRKYFSPTPSGGNRGHNRYFMCGCGHPQIFFSI